jgi:hypothetical protein
MDWSQLPSFDIDALPEDERDAVRHVDLLITLLGRYIGDYENAVSLSHFSTVNYRVCAEMGAENLNLADLNRFGGWKAIAIRDATMTLNHIRVLLESLTGGVEKSKLLSQKTDKKLLLQAQDCFNQEFGQAKTARDSVAHSADSVRTREETELHRLAEGLLFRDNIMGDKLVSSFRPRKESQARLVESELSENTARTLLWIFQAVCSSFEIVEVYQREQRQSR